MVKDHRTERRDQQHGRRPRRRPGRLHAGRAGARRHRPGSVALPELREARARRTCPRCWTSSTAAARGPRRPAPSAAAPPRNPAALASSWRHLLITDPRLVRSSPRTTAAWSPSASSMVAPGRRLPVLPLRAPGVAGARPGSAVLDLPAAGLGPRAPAGSTCAEADQPVSTGLYASLGLAPREPIYLLRGDLDEAALPGLPRGVQPRPIGSDALVASGAVGRPGPSPAGLSAAARPCASGLAAGGAGWLVRGAWTACSATATRTPAAASARSPPRIPPHCRPCWGTWRAACPCWKAGRPSCPVQPSTALRPLMASGLRLDGTPAVYCADRPGPHLDRYLPMSFALL